MDELAGDAYRLDVACRHIFFYVLAHDIWHIMVLGCVLRKKETSGVLLSRILPEFLRATILQLLSL